MTNNDDGILAHALTYARQGWRVLPVHSVEDGRCSCKKVDCGKRGKHPRIREWQKSASSEADKIRAWWATWPDANIGIATGRGSGVFVVDVDGPTGRSTFEKWQRSGSRSITGSP